MYRRMQRCMWELLRRKGEDMWGIARFYVDPFARRGDDLFMLIGMLAEPSAAKRPACPDDRKAARGIFCSVKAMLSAGMTYRLRTPLQRRSEDLLRLDVLLAEPSPIQRQ